MAGANHAYTKVPNSWIEAIRSADVVLMQREVPEEYNILLSQYAKHLILDCGGCSTE